MAHHVPRRQSRNNAYYKFQQQKRRQATLLVAAILGLAVTATLGWLGWQALAPIGFSKISVAQATPPTTAAETVEYASPPEDVAREDFRQLLDRKLGFLKNHSLLYGQQESFSALLAHGEKKLLPMQARYEDAELKTKLEQLFASYPDTFVPHMYYFNPDDGSYVNINGHTPAPAASVIKLPILLAYLMSLDENMLTADTPLLYLEHHRAGGAGELQYRDTGAEFPANEIARNMIRISDNTCTNMIISALGGTDVVNRRLEEIGLKKTRINNWLPDLAGTNLITPYEMAAVLYNLDAGTVLSQPSRHNGLDILMSTRNRRLIPAQIPQDAKIAHKTGDIGAALGDSGIVYMPDNRKYILSIQVERPFNDYTAREIIQVASKTIYDHELGKVETKVLDANLASGQVR